MWTVSRWNASQMADRVMSFRGGSWKMVKSSLSGRRAKSRRANCRTLNAYRSLLVILYFFGQSCVFWAPQVIYHKGFFFSFIHVSIIEDYSKLSFLGNNNFKWSIIYSSACRCTHTMLSSNGQVFLNLHQAWICWINVRKFQLLNGIELVPTSSGEWMAT